MRDQRWRSTYSRSFLQISRSLHTLLEVLVSSCTVYCFSVHFVAVLQSRSDVVVGALTSYCTAGLHFLTSAQTAGTKLSNESPDDAFSSHCACPWVSSQISVCVCVILSSYKPCFHTARTTSRPRTIGAQAVSSFLMESWDFEQHTSRLAMVL